MAETERDALLTLRALARIDGCHPPVEEIADLLDGLGKSLRAVAARNGECSKSRPQILLAAISFKSPLELSVQLRDQPDAEPGEASRAVQRWMKLVEQVQQGRIIDDEAPQAIVGLQQMTRALRSGFQNIVLTYGATTLQIEKGFEDSFESLPGSAHESAGSYRGMLESINAHERPATFRIYPAAGPRSIECAWGKDPRVLAELLLCQVEVRGRLHFRRRARFPHRIDVDEVLPLPREEDLPNPDELYGAAPNISRGMTIQEYMDWIRGELREDAA